MFDGVAEMDILTPYNIFARARLEGGDVEPALVTIDGRETVNGCYGTSFGGLRRWDPANADALIVAGGWIDQIFAEGVVPQEIRKAKDAAGDRLILGGVCSGTLLFGEAGLLAGRAVTTYRKDFDRVRAWDAEVIDARLVDDGDLVTSGSGWLSGLDLALYLIERELKDPQLSVRIEQHIGHDRRGTVWRR
jgi:transcriptional regulator GlxA family with amidase domain